MQMIALGMYLAAETMLPMELGHLKPGMRAARFTGP